MSQERQWVPILPIPQQPGLVLYRASWGGIEPLWAKTCSSGYSILWLLVEATALLSVSSTKHKILRLWRPKHNGLVREVLPFLMGTQGTFWLPQSILRSKGYAVLESRQAAAVLGLEQNLGCLDVTCRIWPRRQRNVFPTHPHCFQDHVPSVGAGKSLSEVSLSFCTFRDNTPCGKRMKYSETNVPSHKKTVMKLLWSKRDSCSHNSLESCGKVRKFPLCLAENGILWADLILLSFADQQRARSQETTDLLSLLGISPLSLLSSPFSDF